ncbi:hypothetical protein E2C01_100495 [Portunus trituberculatus]|uniref:Uncharacterized protein n=1 Tax=Portunus trituberculatus TaxID=210409 RepID=A0A5B7KDP2_PORTR|nr:hypothetical protein [Portunus trituberculatus]
MKRTRHKIQGARYEVRGARCDREQEGMCTTSWGTCQDHHQQQGAQQQQQEEVEEEKEQEKAIIDKERQNSNKSH